MDELESIFQHLPQFRVIICKTCQFAPVPSQVETHLKNHHTLLSAGQRHQIIQQVNTLPDLAHDIQDVVYPKPTRAPVEAIPIFFNGLRCIARDRNGKQCRHVYRDVKAIQAHCKTSHQWVNQQKRGGDFRAKKRHSENRLWIPNRACQRFFRTGVWQRFFEVAASRTAVDQENGHDAQDAFFRAQEEDVREAHADAIEAANVVAGFDSHRSAALPWLQTTGIVNHIGGLKKDEIRTAIALAPYDGEEGLEVLYEAMEGILLKAHSYCFDGPECMLTWQCRVVLSRFQSAQVEIVGRTRAFEPCKNAGTLRTYFKPAKQLLAYIYRVVAKREYHFTAETDDVRRPEDVMALNAQQAHIWQAIRRLLRVTPGQDVPEVSEELSDRLLELWMLLIRDTTGAQRFRSPLVSFCAMLSIKQSTSSWIEPGNFSSHLSAMIWIVQLLIFYDSARREQQGDSTTLAHVKRCCEAYLQQTVETPMGELLRWRLLLFHVSKNTVGDRHATWNEAEDIVSFQGTDLHIDDIPTLLKCEYDECRRLLYDDLMFAATDYRRIHAYDLQDSPEVETVGWDFTQHRDNRTLLQDRERSLLQTIERSEALRRLFVVSKDQAHTGMAWRESALAAYQTTVQEFLQRLCTIIHISSGQPVREPEFFSMTWRNTQRRRRITIRHEKVMIHLQYHKTQQQTGELRDNVRFLPHPVSNLLLDYLVYVQPLRQIFLRQSSPKAVLSPYLFEKGEQVWPDRQLTRCLEQSSIRAGIARLHISNWRQMTVAIVKTKFASHIGYFEEDHNDEDAEEADLDIRIMTKQRNHKTRTVNRAYANQAGPTFGNVWDGLLRMNLRASTLWQDFWGVDAIMKGKKRHMAEERSCLKKRIAIGVYRPKKPWSAEALLGGIRELYGSTDIDWRSAEQEQALTSVMSWKEQVVAILPTGGGKSLLFMLPCTLPEAGITIVVIPLVSLRVDMLRRVKELGIDYLEWLLGEQREAALLFISVEAASTREFRRYAQSLIAQQKLDRIVVDECHLTVTAAEYRPSIVELTGIRSLRTQFVYLTATLPPSLQAEFEERNHLLRPTTIRASSNRPNIFYMVRKAEARGGSLLKQAAAEARDAWEKSGLFDHSQDKVILYVRLREEASELAQLLACNSYTAGSGTTDEKKQILRDWTESGQPFIVATTALAEGFDYPHVRLVINVNEPESLVLFAQESGRAGRDGQRAYSLVLLPPTWQPQGEGWTAGKIVASSIRDNSLRKRRDRQAVHRYLQGEQCYRTSLSEYLDVAQHRRWCMPEDMPCNIYKICHQDSISPRESNSQEGIYTGLDVIQQAQLRVQSELARYREGLAGVRGICLLCRGLDQQWDHPFSSCARRHEVFEARDQTRRRHEQRGRRWIAPYTACFWCLNPQSVCSRAEAESGRDRKHCEDKDVVLPLCYGIFYSLDGPQWLEERFGRRFGDIDAFLDWLGEESQFGGGKAVQAVRVAAERLQEYWVF